MPVDVPDTVSQSRAVNVVQVREVTSSCNQQFARAHAQLLHELRQLEQFKHVELACAHTAQDQQNMNAQSNGKQQVAAPVNPEPARDEMQGECSVSPKADTVVVAGQEVPCAPHAAAHSNNAHADAPPQQVSAERNGVQHGDRPSARCSHAHAARQASAQQRLKPHMQPSLGVQVGTRVSTGSMQPHASLSSAAAADGNDSLTMQPAVSCSHREGCGCVSPGRAAQQCLRAELAAVYMMLCRGALGRFKEQAERAALLPPEGLRVLQDLVTMLHSGNSSLVADEVSSLERQLSKLGVLDGHGDGDVLSDTFDFACSCGS